MQTYSPLGQTLPFIAKIELLEILALKKNKIRILLKSITNAGFINIKMKAKYSESPFNTIYKDVHLNTSYV